MNSRNYSTEQNVIDWNNIYPLWHFLLYIFYFYFRFRVKSCCLLGLICHMFSLCIYRNEFQFYWDFTLQRYRIITAHGKQLDYLLCHRFTLHLDPPRFLGCEMTFCDQWPNIYPRKHNLGGANTLPPSYCLHEACVRTAVHLFWVAVGFMLTVNPLSSPPRPNSTISCPFIYKKRLLNMFF
jgi:hypothetical protein